MSRRIDNRITGETFSEGLRKDNPVFVMLLGMCPVLAVTNSATNALAIAPMAGLREKLSLSRLPGNTQSATLSLMLGGLLSLSFMGFAGLGGGH